MFSLIHPSRNRAAEAAAAIDEWRGRSGAPAAIQHILSVDEDDPQLDAYRSLAAARGSHLVVGRNRTMVEAANRGAQHATGDVLVSISDDFGCPENWPVAIEQAIGGRTEAALLVDDGLDARIMTLPILTRAFYARLGYIYHPRYISMFADDDLTAVARCENVLIDARQLLFPHRHVTAGFRPADDTHRRQNANHAWWHGWRVYHLRRATGFGGHAPPARMAWLAGLRVNLYYAIRTSGGRLRSAWRSRLPRRLVPMEQAARDAVLRIAGAVIPKR